MTDNGDAVVLTSTANGLDALAVDSGVGSSVASSDASASDEHLQTTTNPTRIIHLHNNFLGQHRRLSSPSYSPPVQQFRRQQTPAHMLEYDSAAAMPASRAPVIPCIGSCRPPKGSAAAVENTE